MGVLLCVRRISIDIEPEGNYPVAVVTTAFKSLVQYSIATMKAKEVTNPIIRVLSNARGTTTLAF